MKFSSPFLLLFFRCGVKKNYYAGGKVEEVIYVDFYGIKIFFLKNLFNGTVGWEWEGKISFNKMYMCHKCKWFNMCTLLLHKIFPYFHIKFVIIHKNRCMNKNSFYLHMHFISSYTCFLILLLSREKVEQKQNIQLSTRHQIFLLMFTSIS